MVARRFHTGPPPARSGGLTLPNVLVAVFVLSVGMLGMIRSMLGATASVTQNQNIAALATLSNAFWGVVQSNPAVLTANGFAGVYTAGNYASAPAALRPWLQQATADLPAGRITIAVGPDAGSGATCAVATGCTVTLTVAWNRVATPGVAAAVRSQTFHYQFGL